MDIKILRSLVSDSCNFNYATTTFTSKTSSFKLSLTKQAYAFALQAKQNPASTDFTGTVNMRWLILSRS